MAEKVTISRVSHFDTDKEGNQLKNKTTGRPYSRCLLELVDGRKPSGFGSEETRSWTAGQEVEVIITQSGQYLNFSLPKRDRIVGASSHEDHERLIRIEREVTATREMVLRIYKHLNVEDPKPTIGATDIPYPTECEEPTF